MRTAVVIDDKLLAEARRLTGLEETTEVMREALRALIERESARRLARLGSSEPELREISRRRAGSAQPAADAPSHHGDPSFRSP